MTVALLRRLTPHVVTMSKRFRELITYLRKTNGGLANARNFGIRYILSNLLSIEAIYFLDADNRLHPDAMSRAMSMLDIDDGVDWIYPNIDMFGLGRSMTMAVLTLSLSIRQ